MISLAFLLPLAAGVFLLGINWGLPSRNIDPFLFGDKEAWPGVQIAKLAPDRSNRSLGADVDVNPTAPGSVLNDTDPKRAEIIRRYRLYTYQPDEMITLMALASMKPGQWDFDPRLYQYGGLWIYPVGALIRLCLNPTSSQVYHLDHPEEFAKLYIVARFYTVFWALIGVWAVFKLAQTAGAGVLGSAAAGLLYVFLPVVVNMSHEAKPHLPGAVLTLLAALAAGRFVQTWRARWWVIAGALCGAAAGMVISGILAFVILPAMVLFGPAMPWRKRIGIVASAAAVGVIVYFASNPYVLIRLIGDPTPLRSNLANSKAMYEPGNLGQGVINGARLIAEGATPIVAATGLIGALVALRRSAKPQAESLRILFLLSALMLLQFFALAAGKPGEYGRFALLPDIVLALSAAIVVGRWRIRTFEKGEVLALLVILTILPSLVYLRGFMRDGGPDPRRIEQARMLAVLKGIGASTVGVYDDPAPYLLPPVDLLEWKIIKLPRDFSIASNDVAADVIVRPTDRLGRTGDTVGAYQQISERLFDDLFPAQISWASKPLEIWVRKDLMRQ